MPNSITTPAGLVGTYDFDRAPVDDASQSPAVSVATLRAEIASMLVQKFGKGPQKSEAIAALISDAAVKNVHDALAFAIVRDPDTKSESFYLLRSLKDGILRKVETAIHYPGPNSPFQKGERLKARAAALEALGDSFKDSLDESSQWPASPTKDVIIAADLNVAKLGRL